MVRTKSEIIRAINELEIVNKGKFCRDVIPEYYEALEIALEALRKELNVREAVELLDDDRK